MLGGVAGFVVGHTVCSLLNCSRLNSAAAIAHFWRAAFTQGAALAARDFGTDTGIEDQSIADQQVWFQRGKGWLHADTRAWFLLFYDSFLIRVST